MVSARSLDERFYPEKKHPKGSLKKYIIRQACQLYPEVNSFGDIGDCTYNVHHP